MINYHYAISFRKPLLFMRILSIYIGVIFFRYKPIRIVDLAVFYECNQRCEHCSCDKLNWKKDGQISLENLKIIVNKLVDNGLISLTFTGGEVLLDKKLEEKIKAINPGKLMITLQTNATLLTRERAGFLYKSGVDVICVSLDSDKPEKHNSFRNMENAYEKALEGINNALEVGIKVMISIVVHHYNLRSDELMNQIKFTKKMGVILILNLAVPVGRWAGREDILLTKEDRTYLNQLLREHPHVRTDSDTNFLWVGCPAIKEKVYITPLGEVMPCPFIHISFGNLIDEPFKRIRDRALEHRVFRNYSKICIAAEDRDFLKNYIYYTYVAEKLPISYEVLEKKY